MSTTTESPEQAAPATRGRSTIEFPYLDLDNAVEIAKSVHSVEGDRCEWNQLATKLGVSAEGGGFRMRLLTAKTFGLLTYERGQITLTDTGRRAADLQSEKRARFDAFTSVGLFKQLFDRLNGQPLPPPAAVERMIEGLGVAPKQKERARQTFLRSAKQAGLFDLSSDRLSTPPGLNGSGPKTQATPTQGDDARSPSQASAGSSPRLHPFIEGLLEKLPLPDAEWPLEARARWLTTAANIFSLMYTAPLGDERHVMVEIKDK